MTTTTQSDSSIKKTHLLKQVAINPDAKIIDIAKEVGLSKSQAYNILQEFSKAYVMTEDEQNFPQKILYYYNNDLPSDAEPLDAQEVNELKTVVDRIMKRTAVDPDEIGTNTIPATDGQAINRPNTENTYSKMSANKEPDLSTNESLLVNILQNQKYVQPSVIQKFMNMYRMNDQLWAAYPEKMLASMRAFFGPVAGETAFNQFRDAAPNYVYNPTQAGNGGGSSGMDPMLMMMLMGGGGNMAMLPLLMGGNANPAMLQQAMLVQAQKDAEKKAEKQAQADFMDKALQVAMMKMVNSSADEKRPLDPMALGQQTGIPFSVREELDDSGRARSRILQPFVGGAQQNQRDPLLETMLKSQLDRENMLIQQQLRSNEPIKDLFFQLIPNFKTNSDPIAMLSQVRQAFPELWQKPEDRGDNANNIEALRLKTDTQLAIQEQQIQLEQMKHGWKLEEQDRASSQENAKGWMDMLSTLGEKIAVPLASTVMSGFGAGMLNKNGGGPQQQQAQAQQQAMIQEQRRRQMMAQQQAAQNAELLADQRARENQTPPTPQTDPTVIMALSQMQEKLKQQEEYIQQQNMRYAQMVQQMQVQSRQQQAQQRQPAPTAADIDDSKIAQLPTTVLQEAYHDYLQEKEMNEKIGSKLEVELANREIYEGKNLNNQTQQQQQQQVIRGGVINLPPEQQQVINPQQRDFMINYPPQQQTVITYPNPPPPQVITGPLPQAPPNPYQINELPKAPQPQQVIAPQVIEEQSDDLDMEPITDEEQAASLERGDDDNRLADSQVIAENERGMTGRRDSQVINPPSMADEDDEDTSDNS